MSLNRDAIEQRLRSALRAGLNEMRRDPEFVGRVAKTVAEEMGLDQLAAVYLSVKLKERFKKNEP